MKILLIHEADILTTKQVKKWRKKKEGIGDIYQLSLVGSLTENLDLVKIQINKALSIYNIEKVCIFASQELPLDDLNLKVEYIG